LIQGDHFIVLPFSNPAFANQASKPIFRLRFDCLAGTLGGLYAI